MPTTSRSAAPADRLALRADRLELVIRELQLRARRHERRHGRAPGPLHQAIGDFRVEVARLRRGA